MRLRSDVEIEHVEDGARLHDPVFGRDVSVGPASTAILGLLDGSRSLEEIAAQLDLPLAEVETSVRTLLHLNLVEGAGSDVIARVSEVVRDKASLGRVILGESRFGCIGSGDCCQSYHFGPLAPEDLQLLDSLPIAEKFPHLEAPWTFERRLRADREEKASFLRTIDGHCLFLLDDCKCGLHAHFGYANKPGLCRYYPFEQLATVDGIQFSDKGGCSEFSTTARSGEPLQTQLKVLWPLMPKELSLSHPVVLLEAKIPVDYGYVLPLLRQEVEALEKPPERTPEMLRSFSRRCRTLAQKMDRCAMDPLAPQRIVDEVLALPPDFSPVGEDELRAGAASLAAVTHEIAHVITLIVGIEHAESTNFYSGRQAKELLPILHLLGEIAQHLAEGTPLSDYAHEVASVSVDGADADDVLRVSLRNQLFGHGALVDDRLQPALLRLALVQLAALWGARVRALGDGRNQIVAKDLDRGHMLMIRIPGWRGIQHVLVEEEEHARPVVEALPELARWTPIDSRVEK